MNNLNSKLSPRYNEQFDRSSLIDRCSSSSSYDESTTKSPTKSNAKMVNKKRPYQDVSIEKDGAPVVFDHGRLKRIRHIDTFSVDYEEEEESKKMKVMDIPNSGNNEVDDETTLKQQQSSSKCFANDVFEFDSLEEIFGNPKFDSDEVRPSLLETHESQEQKEYERASSSPICFVVGGGDKSSSSFHPFPSSLMARLQLQESPYHPPDTFQPSPLKNKANSKVASNEAKKIVADHQPQASCLLQQSLPFPMGVLITPNEDGQENNGSELQLWDLESLRMEQQSSLPSNRAKTDTAISLRPKPMSMDRNPNISLAISKPESSKIKKELLDSQSNVANKTLEIDEKANVPQFQEKAKAYIPSLYGLPLPDSMKPIVRILLYLEEHYHHDMDLVRDAFVIVQNCYDRANKNDNISGAVFESLVEHLGDRVDLVSVFQAAPKMKVDSSKFAAYFAASDKSLNTPGTNNFLPTLLQLAVAYGYHSAASIGVDGLGSSDVDTIGEAVCKSAAALCAMTSDEKLALWDRVVNENTKEAV